MPKIKVNDIELYYEEFGKGEPLILVSGFAADHYPWNIVTHRFAKQFRVITFDNRGIGQSSCPDQLYTIDMFTDDVVGLCNQLGIESAHFIGNSMGGMIVQNLAYKYPKLVKTATISNSYAKANMRARLQAEVNLALLEQNAPAEIAIKNVLPWLYSRDFLSNEEMYEGIMEAFKYNPHPITAQGYRGQLNALLTFDATAWLDKITRPCFVIYADDDLFVMLDEANFLIKKIPNCASYCFQRIGHLPHIEQPEVFVAKVQDFICRLS